MPSSTEIAATTNNILPNRIKLSLDNSEKPSGVDFIFTRWANNANAVPENTINKINIDNPRVGSEAKACTDCTTPERTKKLPSKLSENASMARKILQEPSIPRLAVSKIECTMAVATNQGIKEAFSTGSQNHHPPQPSSLYAHQEPKALPPVKNTQARIAQGCK